MEELLRKHGCKLSATDREKARRLWKSKEKVLEWVVQCKKEQKEEKKTEVKVSCGVFLVNV